MEQSPHILTLLATALVSVLSALGLPHLYKHLTDRKRLESSVACQERINELELELSQVRLGVGMMLAVIESEFDDQSSYKGVIDKVKELIKPKEENGAELSD